MTNGLEIALEHAALGLYVFPVARDKSTRTPHGYKDATLDPERIRALWAKVPLANPAVYPGGSGLAVLDVDHGLSDMASFVAWRDRNGIPATYTVRSGSRPEFKVHMYFAGAIPDIGEWKLDGCSGQVKSLGGYVLAAGSEALHGAKHDKPGEPYEVIDGTLGVFAPMPDVIRGLRRKPAAPQSNNSKVPKTRWTLPVHEGENRTGFLLEQTGAMRNLGCGKDAILARMVELNEDPEIIADPVEYDRLESTAANCAKYPVPEAEPFAYIGSSPLVAARVELIEELDHTLTATPLPLYPVSVFENTLYLDFAKRASEGNYVPLEFFIEGAMTYAGAIAGDQLHGMTDEITPRLFTTFVAAPGIGKGSTFRRVRKFAPPHRVLDDIPEKFIPSCSVLVDRAGSENGLNDALLKCPRVIEEFEELDRMLEKTEIQGSGKAFMSIVRTCFDDTVPGITTTKGRPEAAKLAFLSLLGAITPGLWRGAMEGRDSYGSGLGGRFNLVASNEDRTASTLLPMQFGDLQNALERKFAELETHDTTIPTEKAALKVLDDWWRSNSRGKPHYNRVNVIAHRKALHLAWIRGLPVITSEVMGQAIKLAQYLISVREVFAVVPGEDKMAICENRIMNVLRQIYPKGVSARQLVDLLGGLASRNTVLRALESLAASGEAEKLSRKDSSCKRPYAIFRLNPK